MLYHLAQDHTRLRRNRCARIALVLLGAVCLRPVAVAAVSYGNNPDAGHTARVDGIKLYYEIYGTGAPLVLLHGNGGSIADLHFQIDHFRSQREVIAVDSRGHGRSEMGEGPLTYVQMADDVAALLASLHSPPADVFGWSDGGIVTLLLALRHPDAVRRIALSGANLSPEALAPGEVESMKTDLRHAEEQIAAGDRSRPWSVVCQQLQLMINHPHITAGDLARITAPALVMAGEHDMIPAVHTRFIAAGLPHARLHIFPGAGHGALQEQPDPFNAVVDKFFSDSP